MCKIGDIILVNPVRGHGRVFGQHSFIVISDEGGQVKGVDFDMVALIMSSMDTEDKEKHLMQYPGNMKLEPDAQIIEDGGNHKTACVKTDQLYCFDKSKIHYHKIGIIEPGLINVIFKFMDKNADEGLVTQIVSDNL